MRGKAFCSLNNEIANKPTTKSVFTSYTPVAGQKTAVSARLYSRDPLSPIPERLRCQPPPLEPPFKRRWISTFTPLFALPRTPLRQHCTVYSAVAVHSTVRYLYPNIHAKYGWRRFRMSTFDPPQIHTCTNNSPLASRRQVTSYEATFQLIFSRLVPAQQQGKRYSHHRSWVTSG